MTPNFGLFRLFAATGFVATVLAAGELVTSPVVAQTTLPPDPAKTCTVSKGTIKTWFVDGKITARGAVNPADSVGFPLTNTICDFYKWSSQMFLWLNSPAGNGQWVFDSPMFYDVSPESNGKRTLIPNTETTALALRAAKPEVIGETGQAGGQGVLVSQDGALVYYGIHVNDVYAAFLGGQKAGALKTSAFPTTASDLAAIEKFAGTSFSDGRALTLELKTSWVDASTVDKSNYITIDATVPKFDQSSDTKWTPTGSETLELALTGMHIVGSAQGHPEMIWATYEHVGNTPDNAYTYTRANGANVDVPYNSDGKFLFMAKGGAMAGANVERAVTDTRGNIVAKPGETIAASNTFRMNPWGDAGDSAASADNNSQLISINQDVVTALASEDPRRQYRLGGALWTQHGQIPPLGTPKGSLLLANSTMETYHQDINCFACHQASNSIGLSHIYGAIQPLK